MAFQKAKDGLKQKGNLDVTRLKVTREDCSFKVGSGTGSLWLEGIIK